MDDFKVFFTNAMEEAKKNDISITRYDIFILWLMYKVVHKVVK